MAEIKLKKREEMDPAYCWDLSSLFGSDEEFEKTEQELAKKIEAFRAKQGTMKESAKALYDVLSGLDDISRVFSSLYVYASQKYHQDMGNQKYQGYAGKMDSMMAVLADASSFVEPEILELDEETVTEFEKAYEPLRLYDRILKENFRKKEHILSPEMEAVLAKAGEMASSPDQIFSAFSNADLRFQPVTDEEENQVPLSHGTFVGFLQSKDRRVRKEAFEKYYDLFVQTENLALMVDAYNQRLVNMDRRVVIEERGHRYEGTARGIDAEGALLVERDDGTTTSVISGEVSVRGVLGYV